MSKSRKNSEGKPILSDEEGEKGNEKADEPPYASEQSTKSDGNAAGNIQNMVMLKRKMPKVLAKAKARLASTEDILTGGYKPQPLPPSLHRGSTLDIGRSSLIGNSQIATTGQNGISQLMVAAKAKRAGRLFLKLGGAGNRQQSFLNEHPFFEGTSTTLRNKLAPQLVRRSVDQVSADVLQQGEEPQGSTDYLFLTAPDFSASIEVILDGNAVAVLSNGAVFGQEAIFGITKSFAFGIRVPTDAVQQLWVIPRKMLQSLLQREIYQQDGLLLKERAHGNAVSILRSWYLHPISRIKLRLFDNAEHSFKHGLVQAVEMRMYPAGYVICNEQDHWAHCFCIFRGEAQVKIAGSKVEKLAHVSGMSAWGAWWGILEVLGVCDRCPGTVVATTDCIVWLISPESLKGLRDEFPMETSLFDKVAVEHVKLLQSRAIKIHESNLAGKCSDLFLQELNNSAETRIGRPGEVVIKEGEVDDEIFVVARGSVEVRKSLSDDGRYISVATLYQGDWFGEVAALGIREARTASVICCTLCDLRVIRREAVLKALAGSPDQAGFFEGLAEQRGYAHSDDESDSHKLLGLPFLEDFSIPFIEMLAAEMTSLAAFTRQTIIFQGQDADAMFVLLEGKAAVLIDDAKVDEIKAPGIFGERALVGPDTKNFFTVRSQCLCHFRLVTAAKAKRALEKYPADAARLKEMADESLESLRSVLLRRFHGKNLALLAKRQAGGMDDSDAAGEDEKLRWWTNTIFKDSDARFLQFLSRQMRKYIYFAGEMMLRQDDEGDYALIIQTGEGFVEVSGMRVGEIKSGSLVGESVLLGKAQTRTASVRASGLVSAAALGREGLLEALDHFPAEMKRLDELMNLRNMSNQILQGGGQLVPGCLISSKPVRGSFAQTLLVGAQGGSVEDRRQSQLAAPEGGPVRRGSSRSDAKLLQTETPSAQVRGSVYRRLSSKRDCPPSLSPLPPDAAGQRRSVASPRPGAPPRRSCLGALSLPSPTPQTQIQRRSVSETISGASGGTSGTQGNDDVSVASRPGSKKHFAVTTRSVSESLAVESSRSEPWGSRAGAGDRFVSVVADAALDEDETDEADQLDNEASKAEKVGHMSIYFNNKDTGVRGHSADGSEDSRVNSEEDAPTSPTVVASNDAAEKEKEKPQSAAGTPPDDNQAEEDDWRTNLIHKADSLKKSSLEERAVLLESSHDIPINPMLDSSSEESVPGVIDPIPYSRSPSPFGSDAFLDANLCETPSLNEFDDSMMEQSRHTQCSTEWARGRQQAIDVAPMRQKLRLAQRGDLLPLVPASCGYRSGDSLPEVARGGSKTIGVSSALLQAQGIYLRARRFDDQRSLCRSGWQSGSRGGPAPVLARGSSKGR